MALLSNEQVDLSVRWSIGEILPALIENEEQVHILASLLPVLDIADSIYHALWALSRRLSLRIFVGNGPGDKQVEVSK